MEQVIERAKKAAAEKAVAYIKDSMTVGLGSGSTAYWAVFYLADRIKKEALNIRAVPTSVFTADHAKQEGIQLVTLDEVDDIDLTIDGADEIDPQLNLIKGGGGALLREKIVAYASRRLIIIADDSKLSDQLGHFPLPVEVIPFGWQKTAAAIKKLGYDSRLRMDNGQPFVTDNHNYILDCPIPTIADPAALAVKLNMLPGVAENGLFVQRAERAIIGFADGHTKEIIRQ